MSIQVILTNGGIEMPVGVPAGSDLGYIRGMRQELEEVSAPSQFNLAVNNVQQDDSARLNDGDRISFRPIAGNKG